MYTTFTAIIPAVWRNGSASGFDCRWLSKALPEGCGFEPHGGLPALFLLYLTRPRTKVVGSSLERVNSSPENGWALARHNLPNLAGGCALARLHGWRSPHLDAPNASATLFADNLVNENIV
jgi:hypothetical protein